MNKKLFLSTAFLAVALAVSAAPLIGVSPSSLNSTSSSSAHSYINAVREAGGVPVILPMVRTEEEAVALVSRLDALVMTGGEDVNPAYYGEEILNETVGINYERDTSDMLMLDAAVKARIPILGICRGCQIINVYFGGTLYQDLPSQHPSDIRHRQDEPGYVATHKDCIVEDTVLHDVICADTIAVNSFHHQAVKTLGKGLKANCISTDGLIEGLEGDNILALQFHPEKLIDAGSDELLPVFTLLVGAAE